MTTHVKVSGTWRAVDKLGVKVSGAWKDVKYKYVKVSGVWKEVYTLYSYAWDIGSYGSCSKSCGNGIQTRSVKCKRSPDGVTVADSFCSAVTKPSTTIACNLQACTTCAYSYSRQAQTNGTGHVYFGTHWQYTTSSGVAGDQASINIPINKTGNVTTAYGYDIAFSMYTSAPNFFDGVCRELTPGYFNVAHGSQSASGLASKTSHTQVCPANNTNYLITRNGSSRLSINENIIKNDYVRNFYEVCITPL